MSLSPVLPSVELSAPAAVDGKFDPSLFRAYVEDLLPAALGASPGDVAALWRIGSGWEEVVTKFAGDQGMMGIYIQQLRTEDDPPQHTYTLSTALTLPPNLTATLFLLKRTPTLSPTEPLSAQLLMLTLASSPAAGAGTGGTAPVGGGYEALHSLVHLAVAPYFDAYVSAKGRGQVEGTKAKDSDAKMGIPMTKKKFAELELSLLHLQQNVEIPDIHLTIHPVVREAVAEARAANVRPSPSALPQDLVGDSVFLNRLQADVNSWIKEIQNVTKLSRDVASGTASQEINFWLSMERALEGIEEQLKSDPIALTLEVLKHAKRFHATVSFIADTGLKEATDTVHKYNQLMKDFPLNELLSATDLNKVHDSLYQIFSHITKKLKLSPYPIRRALPLVEAISRDFNDQLLKVFGSHRLMYMEYATFERTMSEAEEVFRAWDEQVKEFTNVAREVTRKRSEKFLPIKISAAHAKLAERCTYLRAFRKQHEQLRVMTATKGSKALAAGFGGDRLTDIDMEEEVRAAYETVKNVDVLDVSIEGTEIWVTAETAYNERVARVENQIIARLRDRLGTARNASEMFRVFGFYNALFVRPKIRGAISEYQTQLIESVKEDIKRLHTKFTAQYRNSDAYHMSQLRDLPEIAGAIIWARQIERQLNTYMKRVEDVLGEGWDLYAEGTKLQNESMSFRRKLDTRPIYDAWLHEINRRDMRIDGPLFDITRNRAAGPGALQLGVNFDPQIITLFKEVRNLIWLQFQVSHAIVNIAKDAKRVYPHAVSLMETVRTYSQTVARIGENPGIAPLIAEDHIRAREMIEKGMKLRWEYFVNTYDHRFTAVAGLDGREIRQVSYVREFANVVSVLQDKTDSLIETYGEVMRAVEELATCAYTSEAFSALLSSIQKIIDRLNLEGYANLDSWVADLDRKIEDVLATRVNTIIGEWCAEFSRSPEDASRTRDLAKKRVRLEKKGEVKDQGVLEIKPLVHEVRIQNQVIYLDPPIEFARKNWYQQLHSWLGVVCGLTRIQSSRYEIGLQFQANVAPVDTSYTSILTRYTDNTLKRPFALIESRIAEIEAYFGKWLQFQSLWDLEADHVYNRLGENLALWQQLLGEIRRTRSTFDTSDTQRSFGVAVIDFEQVQSKVNAKYDTWQRDILSRFGGKLGGAMKDVHAAILKARNDLEHHSIEGSSTAQAVTFITFVQDLKKKVKKWTPEIAVFAEGQKTLERQRYQFPSDWLYVDQVQGEWSAFNEILTRKNDSIQEQLDGLRLKIVAEDKIVENKIQEIVKEWEENKPIQGSIKADVAMNTINVFESRVDRLKGEYDLVCRAKEALDLELIRNNRLEPVFEELRDLKAVWTALSGVWSQIAELREINWATVQPRKLRQQLDALLTSTKDMPSRMRQYSAFEYVQNELRMLLKMNPLVSELKSEALRERHWRQLFKILRITGHYSPTQLSLGQVYDLDLKRNEPLIKDVIVQAQGEMALEEFLNQVRETWTNYTLDLVNYQNKCRLIRGWDDLFTKCGEQLNSLTAMKGSPYYKVFEDEANSWEEKLNRIHVLFDVWIDVQRQWVYLEGIFTGSADIKHLLPVESSRFQNINSEFLAVMKKVYKSPFVLDVLNIPGVQKSLERLADLLGKIQKALGEYLERERSSFPRFYFVGDEDLLEIIGNSKDIVRIMKHLKKMFAGIANVLLDDDLTEIRGMVSKEGEEVPFRAPILLKDYPKINDWLAKIESEMRVSLATLLADAVASLRTFYTAPDALSAADFLAWVDQYPAQLVVLAVQVAWTTLVDEALEAGQSLEAALGVVLRTLDVLADTVLTDLPAIKRRKCEHLITELVHQRDVIRSLIRQSVRSNKAFAWLYQMRFYLDVNKENPLECLSVQMANASFDYGYEYLGVPDRLVQTPLTDRCYLTLTQALNSQLGGAPFGPAGTGKTESVKALGVQLGRFVLVFCCDETFDFQAMGRIFIGLCQVGAWGCFDEFNRLEERILSAVSQQVQTIQEGLSAAAADPKAQIELLGKTLTINKHTGLFVTTNPGYAGRSNLPDNLKKLFRNQAMTQPDRELIAQVMLFSQGFRSAETLASKIVPFFVLCAEQLSPQPHYDFGLRALKAVLISAGNLKRDRILQAHDAEDGEDSALATAASDAIAEQEIVIQSVTETIVPKLVADDVPLLTNLLADVFPGVNYVPVDLSKLKEKIAEVCAERHLVGGELWQAKVLQLYQIQNIQHGLMMVGPAGSGKTRAWQVLLAALERLEGVEGVSYVIDPKAMSKEALYGTLDQTTREWNDGLFTHILRKIVDNVRGESLKRHWIIFDGDVDPEWVENLNSVLDDNKLLTLPNGERLNLPPNVRIMFEVEHLKYATLATVSRCGMIWFSEDVMSPQMVYANYLQTLSAEALDGEDELAGAGAAARRGEVVTPVDAASSPSLELQRSVVEILRPFFEDDGLITRALEFAATVDHIMDFTFMRALNTLFSLVNKTARNVLEHNAQHSDFPLPPERVEQYVTKRLLVSIVWAFTGDSKLDTRAEMGNFLRGQTGVDLPPLAPGASLIDFDVQVGSGDWINWTTRVPTIELETHAVTSADVVVPTVDTVRHEEVLYSWLSEHKPLMLCGPPGSGKTMTLFSALRKLPDMEVVGLNFSSATTPELILKTFEQYCEYRKTPNGVILAPAQIGRWLVVFCDEINLPALDKYGTQRVISFLRQLVEGGGYWRSKDMAWVKLERIQFVGACNPPTDPGRVPLTQRFLRHAPLVMVDYPGEISLKQIYGTFNRALLKVIPNLRGHAEPLTDAMVSFYRESQRRFTSDMQAHYVYSPRELTRWSRGIFEAIKPLETLSVEGLVRVMAHEGLRIFGDRLTSVEERRWTDAQLDETTTQHFPAIDLQQALARPILYSNWTTRNYAPVEREALREFLRARMRVYCEEDLDVQLVLFDDVLEHVLRIDRVFRQVQGHALLIGVSGSGKTTLSRFVAWMNGLSIFQIKVHNKYTGDDFDEDLRTVLRRAGTKGEKICFIMDESNVLDSGFLERMNTLLANAEVPGLFEGDEHSALMTACKEGAARDGLMLDSHEELYRWFTSQVARNLHVVFTMNPPATGLASRAATSPALFNRCVINWMGDWAPVSLATVAQELTNTLDLDVPAYSAPAPFPLAHGELTAPLSHRGAVVNALVHVHLSLQDISRRLSRRQGRYNHVTPRHYLDFIQQYVNLFNEKREELEEQQRHLNVGLDKLRDTVFQVEELRKSLALKRSQLEEKNAQANEKLQRMVKDQQQAEEQKTVSIKFQADLEEQKKTIAERKEVVMAELADAEPAVVSAQEAVSNIKKQHLTEVRSMSNPPEAVKLAMESVCTVLGHRIDSWKTVQGILRRDDFISSLLHFDTTRQMTRAIREKMKSEFLSRASYNYEAINRASKACGPLVKWVIAQVRYSEILDKVGPLRNEVQSLEEQSDQTQVQAAHIIDMIAQLEASIARYKDEYAALISETQAIKGEMERVQTKVDRSITLLDSLSSEKERWEDGSRRFETQMSTLAGDVLLSAAFLAYAGFFDQQYRELMWSSWSEHLAAANITFTPELSLSEYLATADERLSWQDKGLPVDDLCIQNAIMLKRFNRYPLIIDPSGQANAFLQREYPKLVTTSFLDTAFYKALESSLRFGTPLLVTDVEHLDPILNPVLNKELRRTGGRVLIRLGNQDIDFSPAFTIFLTTRDPSVEFSPDVCSRVTFVNFTMTRGSLQNQTLDQVLKVERPDVERKRTDLMKLQGEFRLRLRFLEKSLLQALNESTGNILDDDKVIDTLETLKKEAAEVTSKVEETDVVMREVEQVTAEYLPLAQACSSVFFLLDQLNLVNHFYQFSLRFFLDIFDYVLHHNPRLKGVTDYHERLTILTSDLFLVTFERTSRALLHADHAMLAVLLAQIKLRLVEGELDEDDFDFLLEGGEVVKAAGGAAADAAPSFLSQEQASRLAVYTSKLPTLEAIRKHMVETPNEWEAFLATAEPERVIPPYPGVGVSRTIKAVRDLLIVKCLRPDRLLQATAIFVNLVFETDLAAKTAYNLQSMVLDEVGAQTPVALASVPGYDASYRVDSLVSAAGVKCTSVAMGSQEGFTLADQAIAQAARTGTWVLLKNVHLAPSWLSQVEKRLQSLNPNRAFRLFLTMETSPLVPVNILRQSRILMNEPPPGIRANILDSLRGLAPARLAKGPSEKVRLYFLLAWLHAVVQERLRYCPLGWSKAYEFNESDQDAALDTIDAWLGAIAKGRANVDPASIPWEALRTLVKESVYGGRIDRDFDQRLLDSFVDTLFTPAAYDVDFKLVGDSDGQAGLTIPEGTKVEQFIDWASKLPEREPPSWLSLPSTAEKVIAIAQGNALLGKLRKMKALTDDDETVTSGTSGGQGDSQQPVWMRTLLGHCQEWLKALPSTVAALSSHRVSTHDPLFRFFARESAIGRKLLAQVRSDLVDLVKVCEGTLKQTNHLRTLLRDLTKGTVPDHWKQYKVPASVSVSQWIPDFALRLAQLDRLAQDASSLESAPVWLGGLFFPGSFLTATRQKTAHKTKVSLEELELKVDLDQAVGDGGFVLQGLLLEGATWASSRLALTNGDSARLESSLISWVKKGSAADDKTSTPKVNLPVYLNLEDRGTVLFSICLPAEEGVSQAAVVQRAICLAAAA